MINFTARIKNKTFWLTLIPAVLLLAQVVAAPYVLAVKRDFAATDVASFVAEVKRQGAVPYGTPGIGTVGHLAGALLANRAGITLELLPYRGGAEAARDLAAGNLDAAIGSVEGVLAEPPPSTLIRTLSNDGATLQFAGWIDQRHNDLAKTRSEAMRRVRRELREAGFVPPEHVQKVILQRGEADFPQAQENGHARDTSVDRALDAQVGNARRLEDGGDLLRPPPPGSPPT